MKRKKQSHRGSTPMSQFEDKPFPSVMVSVARTTLSSRERLESAWQRTHFRDASTCADPGFQPQLAQKRRDPGAPFAGTRAPLSTTSPKHFGKLRHYPLINTDDPIAKKSKVRNLL
jgi:hypothetical protein